MILNLGIKIRDQVSYPTAPDVKAVLAEMAEEGGTHFTIVYDVKKAHRRVPATPSEWGRQACQVRGAAAATAQAKRASRSNGSEKKDGRPPALRRADFSAQELAEDVYVNKVGAFGVSLAG